MHLSKRCQHFRYIKLQILFGGKWLGARLNVPRNVHTILMDWVSKSNYLALTCLHILNNVFILCPEILN